MSRIVTLLTDDNVSFVFDGHGEYRGQLSNEQPDLFRAAARQTFRITVMFCPIYRGDMRVVPGTILALSDRTGDFERGDAGLFDMLRAILEDPRGAAHLQRRADRRGTSCTADVRDGGLPWGLHAGQFVLARIGRVVSG